MKFRFTLIVLGLVWLGTNRAFSQDVAPEAAEYRSYRGHVVDAETGDPLVFATLALTAENISTVTNSEGGFLLKVPSQSAEAAVEVSYLGYQSRRVPIRDFRDEDTRIALEVSVTSLPEVDVVVPRDAASLVKETLMRKGENYFNIPARMTAFYRETIKKRRRNVSLSEAVVTLHKTPYTSARPDAMELFKSRKSTDYEKLDTVALKLQGGPFNALFVDLMKYPDYLFSEEYIDDYDFFFERNTRVDNRLIFVIGFQQKPDVAEPMYRGRLYIDGEKKILTGAIFSLNITNRNLASRMFVRRKPAQAEVYPTEVSYRVDYREKDGRWYYGYSNALLEFKVDWDRRLFNSVYSLSCEMAVTDWEPDPDGNLPRGRDRIRSTIILSDEASGFADPDFWGEFNIIEPDKSIESAIRKIQRQLRRAQS